MWQDNIYLNVLLVSILVLFAASFYIIRYFKKTLNPYLVMLLFVSIGCMVAEYLMLGFTSLSLKIIFDRIAFTGIAAIPVLWFLAALKISNNDKYINYKTISLISLLPASLMILSFTNEFHGLMWKEVYLSNITPYLLIKEPNVLSWVFKSYSAVIGIFGLILILRILFKEKYYYREQSGLIMPVAVVSLLLITFGILGIEPFNYINITPIVIALCVMFLVFILNKRRKGMMQTIGANKIIDNMGDGVFILSPENKVVSFNNSAGIMFKIGSDNIIGKDILRVVPDINISEMLSRDKSSKYVKIEDNGGTSYYSISTSNIKDFQDIMIGKYVIFRDYTDKVKSEEEIEYLGYHDNLTGLYNRAYFEREIKNMDTPVRLPLSIVVGGVNGLRIVNEAFGRKKGDLILTILAKIFEKSVRKDSVVCRWGEDKFIFIFPKTFHKEAEKIIERIRKKIVNYKKAEVPLSMALGSATKEYPSENIGDIIIEAESNMFKRKLIEGGSVASSIIASLERTLSEKSHETEQHAKRMDNFARTLGKNIGLTENILNNLSLLASLHDIGKVAITEEILLKKLKLTEEEWEAIKKHPVIGSNIVKSTRQIAHISEGILHHHEWWNGAGYPSGLKGEEIPIESRIISIVDAYDVMRNGRPYKKKMSKIEAIEELRRCSGTQFDTELVEIFIKKVLHDEETIKKKTVERQSENGWKMRSSEKLNNKKLPVNHPAIQTP